MHRSTICIPSLTYNKPDTEMGNQANSNRPNASEAGQRIVLRLRSRDIILHYGYKMRVSISDIDVFPHELEGLRLWDIDVIVSRYVILQSDKFKDKEVLVFKAGVGLAGIALRKWTDAKEVTLCDFRDEVVRNMVKNCHNNEVRDIHSFKINFEELNKSTKQYDSIVCPDLLGIGFQPQLIVGLFQRLLKKGGEAVLIMPEKKGEAKRMLEFVNKKEFKITNLILTAQEYENSVLFNRLESEKEFPLIGKVNFYAIIFKKCQDEADGKQEKPKEEPPAEQVKQQKEEEVANKEEVAQVVQNKQVSEQQQPNPVQDKPQSAKPSQQLPQAQTVNTDQL